MSLRQGSKCGSARGSAWAEVEGARMHRVQERKENKMNGSKHRFTGGSIAAGCMVLMIQTAASGAGLLIADGGLGGVLEIREHSVQVTINNGIAVTEVTQVFCNTENRQVEALYTFPVPKDASLANFSMWINGKEMVGEVVEKQRAREIYDSYKRVRRDPGLLEQKDYKTFEMRIFPIGPKADQKVQICYYQELDSDHDWVTYVYPLATQTRKDVSSRTTGRFSFALQARSQVPIVQVESPSHGNEMAVARHGETQIQASLETKSGDLNRDVVVACHVSRPHTGIDMIASRRPGEDGYFCLTLTAGEELAKETSGMDYVFIIDSSGSMADDGKLVLSRNSVEAFIRSLGKDDRFEIITFNVSPHPLFKSLTNTGEESAAKAASFLVSQEARGGTMMKPALEVAYKYADSARTLNVVILSDGMTEQAESRTLLEMIKSRPSNARVFCVGVGNEVNRPLLEQMADDSGGLASFLSPGDNFERQAQSFRRKLTRPAATNIRVSIEGMETFDVEPLLVPNLFHGTPVRMYGRYRGQGPGKAVVRAVVEGQEIVSSADLKFPETENANPEIERMWAWHKVQRLLKEGDRAGSHATVANEVVRLGEAYSIVTQYTSFLVLENDAEYQRWKIDRRNVLRSQRDRDSQQKLIADFEAIRSKAMADLGPRDGGTEPLTVTPPTAPLGGQQMVSTGTPPPPPSRPGDINLQPRGGGPVGPLGVAGIAVLTVMEWRRRRRGAA